MGVRSLLGDSLTEHFSFSLLSAALSSSPLNFLVKVDKPWLQLPLRAALRTCITSFVSLLTNSCRRQSILRHNI